MEKFVSNDIQVAKDKLKRCEKCGHFFSCTTDGDCWCHEVEVAQDKRKQLLHEYNDCLCPNCLKEFA
ncbi:MAG: hypothetical protein GVY19_03355 [Bacteroidetes bacterium]|jgi:ribosomal protein L34E|nr:hypothetical protein [Bacteroidota bacterium]